MLTNTRKKAFRFTNVTMEEDRDTTKCYDSIRETCYAPNAISQDVVEMPKKRRKRVEFMATEYVRKKKKVSFLAKRKKR
jgi:hypothetical protein